MFDLAIRHEEKLYQQKLDNLKKNFNQQLEVMRKELDLIADRQEKLQTKHSGTANTTTATPPPPQKTTTPKETSSGNGIVEKDIR